MARLSLVWTYLRTGLLNELQYRANFFTALLEAGIQLVIAVGGMALIFAHTNTLGGWTAPEMLALLGVFNIMVGFIRTFVTPSMELLLRDVRHGTLDFVLTKPEDSQLLVSVRAFAVWNLLYAAFGVALVGVAMSIMGKSISVAEAAGFVVALLTGGVIVYSFWLMLATIVFWFVRIDNILVIFTSMYEAGRWPVTIYPPVLRAILTFVVPVAFAVTVPAEALTGRATALTVAAAVALAALILVAARAFWHIGLRHYSGASA